MNLVRRKVIKKLMIIIVGVAFTGTSFARDFQNPQQDFGISVHDENRVVVFPFYNFAKTYNIGDYMPKDQGGKFIQEEILGTENDELIVEKIKGGILNKIYGDPINWGGLEKTELEKSVWLNRFYYLPSFARMYFLNGDKEALEFMVQFIRKWIVENPRNPVIKNSKYNWFDMQVAWRSIHLSWCFYLCKDGLSEEDKSLIIESLKEHAELLMEGFGHQKLNDFNHQVHGGLAMLYLGILFPELPQAGQLVERGLVIIEHHLNHAFYNDGGNVEQMFGYYPFEASIFRDALLLCRANNILPPINTCTLLNKAAHYLSAVAQPNGTMPPVNDSYPMPVNPTLKTIQELLNIKGVDKGPKSAYFPDTQIGVMRSDRADEKSWYIMANPAMRIGSHAHAGRLGFLVWAGQQPVLIESGCNNYDNNLLVKWYRTSRAHNTVLIDGKADEETSGSRQWVGKRITENKITNWIENEEYKLIRMNSPASEKANNGVNWTRSLALIRDDYMLVYDHFETDEQHDYEILFHLPPHSVQANEHDKTLLLNTDTPVAFVPATPALYSHMKVDEAYVSMNAKDIPSPLVSYNASGKETHSVMLVSPVKNSASEFRIKQKVLDGGIVLMIENDSGIKDTILFRNPKVKAFNYRKFQIKDWLAIQ